MQLGAEAEGKERMEEDGGEEVAVGVRGGGWGGGGGGETDGGIMEQIKLYYIALYSDPPIEIQPTVQLGAEAEGKERMEKDGEKEVAGGLGEGGGHGADKVLLHCIQAHPVKFCPLCTLEPRRRGRRGQKKMGKRGGWLGGGGGGGGRLLVESWSR